ncbi:arylsulfatase [Coraliomargarita sp. SDUM461003]|uniref:Arylsulfatase n=1 Tax=Thalassobacterium maritimum TaxID=3041265 RepID=A0ABU1AZ41_9BACT|nr:arylsulfatase [Coraliomargarita sp. SDUM461003]MDQ8208237.1 arylsulfatase [Coraliomargarita sp. SDUM461003]
MKALTFIAVFQVLLTAFSLQADEGLPNVVLIVAEDLGYGDLACYGATKVNTPNIDQLAARGRKFTDAHSASAASSPSRYAVLTGEYPFRRELWAPARNDAALLIDAEQATLATLFQAKGYATAFIGNWQLGFGEGGHDWSELLKSGPQQLGFDYFFGLPIGNSVSPFVYVENEQIVAADPADPLVYLGPKGGKAATPLTPIAPEAGKRSNNEFGGAVQAHAHYKDYEVGTRLTQQANDWIERSTSGQERQPFFLYYSTVQIHHPYTPAPQFRGSSEAGLYGDVIHELDWIVGQLLAQLESQGVLEDTLIILTSDNGPMFSVVGQEAFKQGHDSRGELLGYKFSAWEGGHRVPFIASWPGKIVPGTQSDQLLCTLDLFASFAALTDQTNVAPDSINMLPALLEDPEHPLRDHLLIAARQEGQLALRTGKWAYLPFQGGAGFKGRKPGQNNFAGPPAVAYSGRKNSDIQNGRIRKDAPPAQLYELETDLSQSTNLYHEHPDVVKQLVSQLSEYKVVK